VILVRASSLHQTLRVAPPAAGKDGEGCNPELLQQSYGAAAAAYGSPVTGRLRSRRTPPVPRPPAADLAV